MTTFYVKVGSKIHSISSVDELIPIMTQALCKKLVDQLPKATEPLAEDLPERVFRVTWTKPTRKYPSRPQWEIVEIVDWQLSTQFATTDDGDVVKKSTLFRLPESTRIDAILRERNVRK